MLDLGAGLPGIDPLCQVAVIEGEAVVVLVVFVEVVNVVEVEVLVVLDGRVFARARRSGQLGKMEIGSLTRSFTLLLFIITIIFCCFYDYFLTRS